MADDAKLPTEEEIAQLPYWARVAFAARCARRALPMFLNHWPTAPQAHRDEVERTVLWAEQSAATAKLVGNQAAARASAAAAPISPRAADAAKAASQALYAAAAKPQALLKFVIGAVAEAVDAGVEEVAIRNDFEQVLREGRLRKWNDKTPVPPSVFSPLVASTTKGDSLSIDLFLQPDADPKLVGDAVVKLWAAANEYHMSCGGGVLTFDEFKQLMPALVPVSPKAGG